MSSERARAVAYAVQYLIRCTGKSAEHDTEIAAAAREVLAEKLDALIAGPRPVGTYFGQPFDERTAKSIEETPLAGDAGRSIEQEVERLVAAFIADHAGRFSAGDDAAWAALMRRINETPSPFAVHGLRRRIQRLEAENARLSAMLSGKPL